jgi:hypothetical protein
MFEPMKRIHSLLLSTLTVAVICGSVSETAFADQSSEKFGNGRLLRKWRDDLFGKSEEPKPGQPKAADPSQQPTPAGQRQSPNYAQMTPAQRQQYAQQQLARQQSSAGQASRSPQANPQPGFTEAHRSSGLVTEGFGMEIRRDPQDKFYVAQTIAKGNAAKAGVQRGDQILQVGGVELTTLEELDEIAKILGEGDQLEFELTRRGGNKKILVQFGEAKEVESDVPGPIQRSASLPRQSGQQVTGRYDFVPQPTRSGFHSVLERPALEPPVVQEVRAGRTLNRQVSQPQLAPQAEAQRSSQRLTLQQLEREIDRRQQMQTPAAQSSPAVAGRTVLESLSLNGSEN